MILEQGKINFLDLASLRQEFTKKIGIIGKMKVFFLKLTLNISDITDRGLTYVANDTVSNMEKAFSLN